MRITDMNENKRITGRQGQVHEILKQTIAGIRGLGHDAGV